MNKPKVIMLRITRDEYARIKATAKLNKLSMNEFIKRVVLENCPSKVESK